MILTAALSFGTVITFLHLLLAGAILPSQNDRPVTTVGLLLHVSAAISIAVTGKVSTNDTRNTSLASSQSDCCGKSNLDNPSGLLWSLLLLYSTSY